MRTLLVGVSLLGAIWTIGTAPVHAQNAPHRVRPASGAVIIRGIAVHVGATAFTLQTASRGSFAVDYAPPTHVVEKGRTGHVTVAEGDHVGVRGYLRGRAVRATDVRIYPVAAKPFSLRGTITDVRGWKVSLKAGGGSRTIDVTRTTVIRSSRGTIKVADLRTGERVDVRVVRVGGDDVAIHIHVYGSHASPRHVRVSGAVISASERSVTVQQAGARQTVATTAATRIYSGTTQTHAIPVPGQHVTVYACCVGRPLTATSIHIRASRSAQHAVVLRGTVVALSATSLRLDTARAPLVRLSSSTTFELGASRVTRTTVRPGDLVSVRGYLSAAGLDATRVHVFVASRAVATLRGSVQSVSATTIRVQARGSLYTVSTATSAAIRLGGRSTRIAQLRTGDRVTVVGHLSGRQMQAVSIDARRTALPTATVRGTVSRVGATWLIVTAASGESKTIRLSAHTRVQLLGRLVGGGALFPGVHVVARGTRTRGELAASSVAATATAATVTGRLVVTSGRTMTLRRSSRQAVTVDVPASVTAKDGTRHVTMTAIGRGAYLQVRGYLQLSKVIRAVTVSVLHPTLTVRGNLTWRGGSASLHTSTGETYAAIFPRATVVTVEHLTAPVHPSDIPTGTVVRVVGTVDITGALDVQSLSARLRAVAVRGKIAALSPSGLELGTPAASVHVRLVAATEISQGTHDLQLTDLVPGDDITVTGYGLSGGVVVARKLAVHRRLVAVDGSVTSTADRSFVLSAADGSHTVLVPSGAVVSGAAGTVVSAGMSVHVTGYLRGDGSILATRVRIVKPA